MFNPNDYVALIPKEDMGCIVDIARKDGEHLHKIENTHHIVPLAESVEFIRRFPQQPREFFVLEKDTEIRNYLIEQGVDYLKED